MARYSAWTIAQKNSEGIVFESGGGMIAVYESGIAAGSGQATSAWWTVDDVEATVKELKARGVTFLKKIMTSRTYRAKTTFTS